MYHLLAFMKASAGGQTNEPLLGVVDSYATLSANSFYILPKDWLVNWAYALGPTITNARINTPKMRSVSIPSLGNIDIGTAPTSLPAIDWFRFPFLRLNQLDETDMDTTDAAAGAETHYGFLGLTDQPNLNMPSGDIFTLRATAAITAGNKVWGMGSMTFDQTLPAGTYDVVGMDVVGANLIAARLVFQGGGPRPGIIARTSIANKPDGNFRTGKMGQWGSFTNTAQPYIELFGNAAPTTQTIFLDVIKR